MSQFNDITGQRFHRLVAVSWERVVYANRQQVIWTCRCDCGGTAKASSSALKNGKPMSCGCLNSEVTAAKNRTHGMRHSLTYNVWQGMIQRCTDPNQVMYPRYGGRGIQVCRRWRESFEAFLQDMGERPGPDYSIDRINNDGDYEPGNCRWASRESQGANRSNNVLLTHGGRTQTLAQWARELGVKHQVLRRRLSLGWSHSDTLSRPVRGARV